ncbi:MAG: hypothetical protein IE889_08675 [Campylobacterales bacterium]|nr:hypothetical protein [Campylobacterales bacterium]
MQKLLCEPYTYPHTKHNLCKNASFLPTTFVEQLENSICVEPGDVEALMEAIHSFKGISFKKSLKNQQFIKENFVQEIVNLKFLNLIESQEIIGGKQDKILSFK